MFFFGGKRLFLLQMIIFKHFEVFFLSPEKETKFATRPDCHMLLFVTKVQMNPKHDGFRILIYDFDKNKLYFKIYAILSTHVYGRG